MRKIHSLCEKFNKLAEDLGFAIKDTNSELFEVLSKAQFLSKELFNITNGKEFAYLINEVIQTLPLILTYARKTISIDKSMFLDYKNLRDHISQILEEYMAYNKMYIDSPTDDEEKLQAMNINFRRFCVEFKEFLDKVILFVNAS